MTYIFTITFISKLVLNLCKNFCAIAWYQKPTYSVINPTRIDQNFCSRGQTQRDPNLNPGGPTGPKIGFISVSIEFIKYTTGLNPILNPF